MNYPLYKKGQFRPYRNFYILLCLSFISFFSIQSVTAQTDAQRDWILERSDTTFLNDFYLQCYQEQTEQLELADSLATLFGWERRIVTPDGTIKILIGVTPQNEPIYDELSNADASKTTRTDFLNSNGGLGLNLNGQGMKIFMWDIRSPRYGHQEFMQPNGQSRAIDNDENTNANLIIDHGTHIMGTLIGSGLNPEARGMAPEAICYAHSLDMDITEATSAVLEHGMLLSNHSYRGDTEDLDWTLGAYVDRSRDWDLLMFSAPYYLMVTSAGNNSGGAPIEPIVEGMDDLVNIELVKNSLSIANCHDIEPIDGEVESSDIERHFTSSFGPTDDLRMKPDLAGNGVEVLSAGITSDEDYYFETGTSMASPNVAGSLLLLQEHYSNVHGTFMRAASLKGLALHTADIQGTIGTDGPNPGVGWGMLNARRAAEVISDDNMTSFILEETLQDGETMTFVLEANGDEPLQASISWTDPAGPVNDGNLI